MKLLLLPNAFKGSLSAVEVISVLTPCLSKQHIVKAFPISDGGDGFLDFFRALDPQAHTLYTNAKNASLQNRRVPFLLLSDGKTAVIETARICGLGATSPKKLHPLTASSYGVGQVILKAVQMGAKNIYIGLGGVACSDGGAGMAAACGAILSDKQGNPLPLGASPLLKLTHLELSPLQEKLGQVRMIAVTDVANPLLGPKSSAKVFGPQKGASPAQIKILDKAMARWAQIIRQSTGRTISHTPGTAAAGAIAAGLYGCFKAQLLPGADFLIQKAPLKKYIKWANLIITSEGRLDRQTFYGKAPLAVLKLAKKYHKKTLFICGEYALPKLFSKAVFPSQIAVLSDFAKDAQDAKQNVRRYLVRLCKNI